MPKYFCDYCDTYLTHDSPSVRKTHCSGRKHKENVRTYYQTWMEEQAQELIDKTTQAFQKGKIANNPFGPGAAIPPPMMGPNGPMGPMPMGGPMMRGPGPMMGGPQMMPMRPMGPPMMGGPVMMMGPRPGMQ
uniref:U1 small nuclear ribonucleoprotein C n=1 Tax=Phallusia mammillata TaxID=59560 RepID=A0A6F9DSM7_9ASCI|nr:U1 small nuclear ribonucleoprotein C [Phallusia mammillata]